MGGPWQAHLLKPHGTEARARKHWRDGEKPCPACAGAERRAHWGRRHGPGVIPLPRRAA
jgi:hypothetical protein